MANEEERRVVKIEVELDTRKAKKKAKDLEKELGSIQGKRKRDSISEGISKERKAELIKMAKSRQKALKKIGSMQARLIERTPSMNMGGSFKKSLKIRNQINMPNLDRLLVKTNEIEERAPILKKIKKVRMKPVSISKIEPHKNDNSKIKPLLKLDVFNKMKNIGSGFLKMNKIVALTLGTFMMLNSAVGNVIQTFDQLNQQMAEVDKNIRITNASREAFRNPEHLDRAIERISELSGMTRGQAGAQLGTIYSEFKASGQPFEEKDMMKLAELAFAYANTSTSEVSMDKAFERIQGLVSGRTSAREAGLLGYSKGSTVEASLNNIEKLLKARSTYESTMRGGTYASITARGANVLTNTFERMYERAPVQLRNNAVSITNYKETALGSRDPETQGSFIKAFNSIGAILDKLSTLTSPNKTLSLFIEMAIRTFDLLTELWIGIEPFVNILLQLANSVLSALQPIVAFLTRTTNLIGSIIGIVTGAVSSDKMIQVWDNYKHFMSGGIIGNAPEGLNEGDKVVPSTLPPANEVKTPKKQKISYVNDMGVLVETVITVNSRGKLENDTKVVD